MTALIYVVGLVYIPRPAYLSLLVILLLVEAFFEWARLKIPSFRMFIENHFAGLLRTDELHRLSGMFWMLLGVLTTTALLNSIPLAAAALLYLIIGDAAASLIGKRLRGPTWPGSHRTIGGSAACFFFCFFIGMVILKPIFGWWYVGAGAAVATMAEAGVFRINDNFAIPVASALVFRLLYSVPL